MNSKKPIPNISPLQNEDRANETATPGQTVASFHRAEKKTIAGLFVYGILSLILAGFALSLPDTRFNMASFPFAAFGILFIWLGFRLRRNIRVSITTPQSGDRESAYLRETEKTIHLLRRLKDFSTILIVLGICGILLLCFIEGLTYSAGLWLALTLQAGIFTAVCLICVFRLEIHFHEITRAR